jgi:catechol 2,3-dioxygenase-like lactoylglutathione lyase family enzyme
VLALSKVVVGDDPAVWESLGFAVDGARCWIGGVEFSLAGGRGGITGWELGAVEGDSVEHPNGAIGLDHLVVFTPDLDASIDDYSAMGLELRRVRDAGGGRQQAFFRVGTPILEVVGPMDVPAPYAWGLTFTARDLDATAALLGDRLHAPKNAVQPGRRIATVDRSAGSTTAIAFMSA